MTNAAVTIYRMTQEIKQLNQTNAELREALEDALSLLNDAGREDGDTWQPGQSWIFAEDKIEAKNKIECIRAAIAKAKS
jgi:hypothetical protein